MNTYTLIKRKSWELFLCFRTSDQRFFPMNRPVVVQGATVKGSNVSFIWNFIELNLTISVGWNGENNFIRLYKSSPPIYFKLNEQMFST